MSEERSGGIWFILILFVIGAIIAIVGGIMALASPNTIINLARGFGIDNIINGLPIIGQMFGINPLNGQPLLSWMPALGILLIIAAVVVLIDIWGLWTLKSWAWILTVLISIGLVISLVGIVLGLIYLWILFKEDTKMAYGHL